MFGRFRVKPFNDDQSINKFCASFTRLCRSRLKYTLLLAGHFLKSSIGWWGFGWLNFSNSWKKNSFYETIKKYLAVTTSLPYQMLLKFVRNKVTSISLQSSQEEISLQSSQEERKSLKIKNNIDKVLFLITKPSTHKRILEQHF